MAQIDREAAKKELQEASALREKADQLVTIAGELEHVADRREQDAMALVAPARPPRPTSRRKR
jgi:hypothetical protein